MRAIGRMISINIETGTQTVLEEFVHRLGDKSETLPRLFKGPYLTVEGNAFYYVQENVQAGRKPPEAQIQMAPGVPPEKASLTQNHILRTAVPHSETLRATTDALYLVRADLMDSIKISNKFYGGYMGMPVSLSRDTTHIMFGGVIVRLADDKQIILDTLIQKFPKPEGTTACGFMDECFNPKFTEVAFRVTCDDGHNYVFDRMGVFDYTTNQFVILDTLLNLNNCQNPAYAPDGKRISFSSEGTLYFLKREVSRVENKD